MSLYHRHRRGNGPGGNGRRKKCNYGADKNEAWHLAGCGKMEPDTRKWKRIARHPWRVSGYRFLTGMVSVPRDCLRANCVRGAAAATRASWTKAGQRTGRGLPEPLRARYLAGGWRPRRSAAFPTARTKPGPPLGRRPRRGNGSGRGLPEPLREGLLEGRLFPGRFLDLEADFL